VVKFCFVFLEIFMNKAVVYVVVFLLICSGASAEMVFSGILDSTVAMNTGAGDSSDFTFGFEQFANVRFQSRLREGGTFFGAVNLLAASGSPAAAMEGLPGVSVQSENFAAAIEVERLHFRLRGEHIDLDGGLMRLPFGYSQVWRPSDFLNPGNPLKPDARPRGILGAAVTWYPIDELKLLGFFSAPRNPFSYGGEGILFGTSADRHWDKASVQALYSFETPDTGSDFGIHRVGFSVKADVEIGLVIEALYSYNHQAETGFDGLSFSIGADYSFLDGNLIVLAEYLYNGESSSTSFHPNRHNFYTGLTYRFNDFTNMNAAFIFSLEDVFFTPMITLNHDLFQGVVLTLSAQAPFDSDSFYGVNCSVRVRLRF
jgi:hypothetical protein